MQIGSNNIRAHVGDFIFTPNWWMVASRIIAAFCRRTRKTSGSRLRSPQAGVCSRGNSSNEKFRGVRLYVSENQLKITPITRNRKKRKRSSTLPIAVRDGNRLQRQLCAGCPERAEMENVRMMLTDSVSSVQIEDAAHSRLPMLSCQ